MIDVDVIGLPAAREALRPDLPDAAGVRELCLAAAARAGIREGHLAVEFVDAARIAALNAEHRNEAHATDVLSFPIDGPADDGDGQEVAGGYPNATAGRTRTHAQQPDRELGDVVICLEHTRDVREAIVHGVLHLAGLDHETDDGDMLALQREVLAAARAAPGQRSHPREGR
ncbi:MAG TPA: rRNA maturation RNase YbeY [Solirubrobacteraceae bacterium]|nr:rRNA maturation RNase YbeY [Solirubrobacteraceae bacterium]